ncbi:hypothetical protein Ddc_12126 [Ditylenchus destructor]|nr:hypothetical protein Ddc_12126 [Ditylenchus destructor]
MDYRNVVYWAALLSWILAITEFTSSLCSLIEHYAQRKPPYSGSGKNVSSKSVKEHPPVYNYNYYLEMANGTRIRQFVPIKYDDRRAQTVLLYVVLIIIAIPGFAMPYLLYLARAKSKYRHLYVWWICWVTLHNVHSSVDMFVTFAKCVVHLQCFRPASMWQNFTSLSLDFTSICSIADFIKDAVTPFTIYLSFLMATYYYRMTQNHGSASSSSYSSNSCLMDIERRNPLEHKKSTISCRSYTRRKPSTTGPNSRVMGAKRRATSSQIITLKQSQDLNDHRSDHRNTTFRGLGRALVPTVIFGSPLVPENQFFYSTKLSRQSSHNASEQARSAI